MKNQVDTIIDSQSVKTAEKSAPRLGRGSRARKDGASRDQNKGLMGTSDL